MIKLIAWSKDRAMQLDLLLYSLEKFTPGWFDTSVIYKVTTDKDRESYSILQKTYDKVTFVTEGIFAEDTLNEVKNTDRAYVAFSTDDTVIYRAPPFGSFDDLETHLPHYESECFSFRLGHNTVIQDPHEQTLQPALKSFKRVNDVVYWNAVNYHPLHNYGYTFALDMHAYRQSILEELLQRFSWKNTNQLESGLFNFRRRIQYMASFTHSIAVNIPMNSLSQVTRAGEQHGYSTDYLTDRFLEGFRISLEDIGKREIVGCHQEIPLKLEKRND